MRLRVGIAGYGLAGRYFHAPLLRGCGFEVAAIQTGNPERIAHALLDFPNTTVVATIEDLVAQQLDLVVVASANVVHAEPAQTAALLRQWREAKPPGGTGQARWDHGRRFLSV